MQFLGAKTDEEVKEACMANADVARSNELLEYLSAEPSAQELARRQEMALVTYNLQLSASRGEGLIEGRVEGRAEGRTAGMADALSRVLAHRFGPIPADVEHRLRTASTEALSRWIDHALEAPSLEALLAL